MVEEWVVSQVDVSQVMRKTGHCAIQTANKVFTELGLYVGKTAHQTSLTQELTALSHQPTVEEQDIGPNLLVMTPHQEAAKDGVYFTTLNAELDFTHLDAVCALQTANME